MSSSSKRGSDGHAHGLVKLSGLARLSEAFGQETSRLYVDEFVDRLKSVLRKGDRLLKLSTDKYCMILQNVRDEHMVELAGAKLERVFSSPMDLVGSAVHFKMHAGFAVPGHGALDSSTLVRRAETALRNAHASDQPFQIFDARAHESDQRDPALTARIRRGVERGEFSLYYQPKFSAAYRTLVGAEGLVRWHDEEEKRVRAPGEFIEAAEQDSIIETLTEQLMKSAVARCSRWNQELSVSVNVTPRLLEFGHFVQAVADVLDFYAFAPPRLTLEVTERGNLPTAAFAHLQALRDLGVVISIDDFGTGHCSLSYFRDLPADQIKIDLSFVRAMHKSKKDLAIVRGSIDLAHYCDMQVVAEGVEDEVTADLLTEMGCDVLQGYWFDKPLDAQTFEERYLAGLCSQDEPDQFSELL